MQKELADFWLSRLQVHTTQKLVEEYLAVIDNYKDREYILDKLGNCEVHVETAFGRNMQSMTC